MSRYLLLTGNNLQKSAVSRSPTHLLVYYIHKLYSIYAIAFSAELHVNSIQVDQVDRENDKQTLHHTVSSYM